MVSELWTWERCGTHILSLRNRLGFAGKICFLKYCITDNGTVHDELNGTQASGPETLYWMLTHYAQGKETPLTNELVPFNKLPGGYAFFGAFRHLTIDPLLDAFGERIKDFERCCLYFHGTKCSFGDISFQIHALPLIPLTIVLWEKTEEFPPRCSFFYDKSASNYLPTEDLAHLGELLSYRLREVQRVIL